MSASTTAPISQGEPSASNIILPIKPIKGEARLDGHLIAEELGIKPKSFMGTVTSYRTELETLGQLPFQTEVGRRKQGGGNPEKRVFLNENQAVFLMTLSRNTPQVVCLKLKLVKAFAIFREGKQARENYLPGYHQLMDTSKLRAEIAPEGSSLTTKISCMNLNKLINSSFGIKAGMRHDQPHHIRSMISTAQYIAENAMQSNIDAGGDHKTCYAAAKLAVGQFVDSQKQLLLH